MKIPFFYTADIDAGKKELLGKKILLDNIHRGKILATVVIGFESLYAVIDIITSILKVDSRFQFNGYLIMYLIMIFVNVLYLLFIRSADSECKPWELRKKYIDIVIVIYTTFVMTWGSVVTLMDQKLYGQIIVFMVNMTLCSVIYLLDHKKILIPYAVSILTLALGLPFFQKSSDILIGHYVNLSVFALISWLASRILYNSYCNDFNSTEMLNETNRLLQEEIKENRKINNKLAAANNQLKELTLLDELTGIPNRRSFRAFIENGFERYLKEDSTLSIIMIDIDFFKQFNDYYGHEEGDKALVAIANQIYSVIEEASEFVVRWGGEEFIYAAFDMKADELSEKANAIIAKVSDLKINHNDSPINSIVTVSLGVGTIKIKEKRDINKVITLADQALYQAKSSGRNRAVFHDGEE